MTSFASTSSFFKASILFAIWFASSLGGLGASLQLSSPTDFQVFQRSTAKVGKVLVIGQVTPVSKSTSTVEVRLVGEGQKGKWKRLLRLAPQQTRFTNTFEAPAGGWYQMEVRVRASGEGEALASVAHVGVGEIFVITGQSNSANHGDERQQPKSGRVATFSGTAWAMANDPQPGASGGGGSFVPAFGDAMVERFGVPVGIVAVGVGGTSVREWLPKGTRFPQPPTVEGNVRPLAGGGWEAKGNLFDNLVKRMKQLPPHGFRAVLWHQGESDANQSDPRRTLSGDDYRRFMELLMQESRREVGWDFPWFVAQVSYHTPTDTGSPEIRAAQAALWKSGAAMEGPDTDQMVGDLRDAGGKGIHFSGKGLRVHGAAWAAKVGPWLERQLEKK